MLIVFFIALWLISLGISKPAKYQKYYKEQYFDNGRICPTNTNSSAKRVVACTRQLQTILRSLHKRTKEVSFAKKNYFFQENKGPPTVEVIK